MNLASKSLFGDSVGDNTHPFETYTKYLSNNGKSLDYVVTQLSFNEDNDNQSILFTPTRFINKGEYAVTSKAAALPETQKMVVMTPYQADTSGRATKLEAPKAEAPKAKVEVEEDDAVEVPKKRESKKTVEATPASKKSLDSVVAAWTEEE
jgi:hypothetical protein